MSTIEDDRKAPGSQSGCGAWAEATDEALIAAVASARDRTAFAELFHRFAGKLKGFLMRAGMTSEMAEEAVQDVMVAIWRRAETFDPAKAGAATWIYTIARNRRIDLLRRQSRPEPEAEDPMLAGEAVVDPETAVAGADRDARVRQCLAKLSTDQRDVIRLAFFAGLSHGEVAAELGLPLGTVKSRLRLAFSRLRVTLGEDFAGELRER
ncbi:MAG: sigma-70 family RNA polymerase sigma factor [Pseudomonadota bacterium]